MLLPGTEGSQGLLQKAVGVAALVLAGACFLAFRFQRELLTARLLIHEWLANLQLVMAGNWLAFAFGQTLVAACGILPASIIAAMAGALLGFGPGLAISVASTMLGGWIAFALSRTALRRWITPILHRHPSFSRLDHAMTCEGWRMVMLLRISPVMPFALTSYGLGLTRISQRDFLAGTLASLPSLVGYVALGALGKEGLRPEDAGLDAWRWAMLLAGAAVVLYCLYRLRTIMARLVVTA
ncbi:Uncharacterized membrane protein YdjX, TVP38/TMEM64 family, SNARE-associated domain [Novosphingobium mathurense]|uniref:TVP38/TMEM64 family membrane protein n=1 Tax=Novosphingobium mathurense TaxID=428990 RepID=A0A1U6IRK7_9SPHN|nr:Uncharacterized membrane protein YdjX, TVP38/TMEM64 family, SNARE-associated domain [Novosphingobium mathurense]